jgi:hypothetical protein
VSKERKRDKEVTRRGGQEAFLGRVGSAGKLAAVYQLVETNTKDYECTLRSTGSGWFCKPAWVPSPAGKACEHARCLPLVGTIGRLNHC